MESVQKWFLSGCGYQEGVAIYATLPSCTPILLKRLRGGQDAARLEKLKHELKKFHTPVPAPVLKVSHIMPATKIPVARPAVPVQKYEPKTATYMHDLPPELRPVLLQANDTFKRRCLLKVALNELAPEMESEALAIQLEMFYLRRQNMLCWQKIDYWREHKALPPVLKNTPTNYTNMQLLLKRQNLHSSLSRLRPRLAKNIAALELAIGTKAKSKLQRAVAKQMANLLLQEQEQLEIIQLINAKPTHE